VIEDEVQAEDGLYEDEDGFQLALE